MKMLSDARGFATSPRPPSRDASGGGILDQKNMKGGSL